MTIKLHPSSAFGDGQHPTTQGMMRLMNELKYDHQQEFLNILDMGCGSGILSILAAQLWPDAQMIAADIKEEAVAMTQKNAALNAAVKQVRALRSDGVSHAEILTGAPYDLVIANMLAEPLLAHAKGLVAQCKNGGILLLSGILDWQLPQIHDAYEALSMQPLEALQAGEWCSIMLTRQS